MYVCCLRHSGLCVRCMCSNNQLRYNHRDPPRECVYRMCGLMMSRGLVYIYVHVHVHLGLEGCSQPRELWFSDILMYCICRMQFNSVCVCVCRLWLDGIRLTVQLEAEDIRRRPGIHTHTQTHTHTHARTHTHTHSHSLSLSLHCSMNGLDQLDLGDRRGGRVYVQEGPAKLISVR